MKLRILALMYLFVPTSIGLILLLVQSMRAIGTRVQLETTQLDTYFCLFEINLN